METCSTVAPRPMLKVLSWDHPEPRDLQRATLSDPFRPSEGYPRLVFAEVNALNKMLASEGQFRNFRTIHRRWLERCCIGLISSSEYLCLSAISSRTLGWNKLVEVIALSVFENGLQDLETNAYLSDDDNLPFFTGTGLNTKTIRTATRSLHRKGLIERFEMRVAGRDTYGYMALSVGTLIAFILHYELVVPENIARIIDRLAHRPPCSEAEQCLIDLLPARREREQGIS